MTNCYDYICIMSLPLPPLSTARAETAAARPDVGNQNARETHVRPLRGQSAAALPCTAPEDTDTRRTRSTRRAHNTQHTQRTQHRVKINTTHSTYAHTHTGQNQHDTHSHEHMYIHKNKTCAPLQRASQHKHKQTISPSHLHVGVTHEAAHQRHKRAHVQQRVHLQQRRVHVLAQRTCAAGHHTRTRTRASTRARVDRLVDVLQLQEETREQTHAHALHGGSLGVWFPGKDKRKQNKIKGREKK